MAIYKASGPPWPYYSNLVLIDPRRGPLAPFGALSMPIAPPYGTMSRPKLYCR